MNITQLIRPEVTSLEAYVPIVPFEVLSARLGRAPDEIIKLDANENPYGPSPRVRAALAALPFPHIYPDPEATALRAALAADTGVPAENLLAGSGADDLIDLLMRIFLEPGDAILDFPPTFGMYAFDAGISGGRVVRVTRRDDFSLDINTIEDLYEVDTAAAERMPKLIFAASPNNPDGSVLDDDTVRRLLALPAVVVLDEAYIEFHGPSRLPWVLEHDNLVVLRTFSKRAGLAGLRVGYGAFPSALMPHLWKVKQPYNVSAAASAAAIAAVGDAAYMAESVTRLTAERDRMAGLLTGISYLRPYPSRANFVLCRVIGREARQIVAALAERGILVRYFNKS
ncbi:MAG: histidinol-phosphate transaminase, partial [Anaerolineales bacterium]